MYVFALLYSNNIHKLWFFRTFLLGIVLQIEFNHFDSLKKIHVKFHH